MEYDVVVVGAGPAGLACAIRLKQLKPDTSICVLEKASAVGAQRISGCALEPGPLDALLPDWRETPPDICVPAARDEFWYDRRPAPRACRTRRRCTITATSSSRSASSRRGSRARREARRRHLPRLRGRGSGVRRATRVKGVRIGDMGLDKDGKPGPNYTPGVEIHAGTTILAEGARGCITKQLIANYNLREGRQPPTFGLGFKELWQLPPGRVEPGRIEHAFGWPLDPRTYGGSFLYHLDNDRVYVGYVVGLNYEDPRFKPFEAFQQFKHHPRIKPLLEGGEILAAGARTIAAGGYQSLPKLEMPGALLIGDAAGTLNVFKIKGIHQAIRSGVLAAEHLAETGKTAGFDARWRASDGDRELHAVRNFKPAFKRGLYFAMANAGLESLPKGHTPWTLRTTANHLGAGKARRLRRRRPRLGRRAPAAARSARLGVLRRQRARRIAAGASECAGHVDLRDALHQGIRQPLRELLPGRRLRDGGRRPGRPAPADQRRELRALQGLRHQGSVRDHQLDHAGRRLRAELPEPLRWSAESPIWSPSPERIAART